MIPNLAEILVADGRKRASETEHKEWMDERDHAVNWYDGFTHDETKNMFAQNLIRGIPVANVRMTRRVIDRISRVYMVNPIRSFDGDDDEKVLNKYLKYVPEKNLRMKFAERRTNLLGVIAIHPRWNARLTKPFG